MKTIGIVQPNYLPWRGFFDFIHEVDTFVFYDDVQYTLRDWRNRNRILTRQGKTIWLTVPTVGGRNQLIKDVAIDNTQRWRRKHLGALQGSYGKTPHFDEYFSKLEPLINESCELLAELDIRLIEAMSGWMDIETEFVLSSSLETSGSKDDKLLQTVGKVQGERYLSGPAAKAYIQDELWEQAGVDLMYKDYSGYPEYPQIAPGFEPSVSVLDLLFMVGDSAADYIWGARRVRDA